eukprot:COSAG02_NODE_9411_length_2225_cov_1.619003_2_plen_317_part_00
MGAAPSTLTRRRKYAEAAETAERAAEDAKRAQTAAEAVKASIMKHAETAALQAENAKEEAAKAKKAKEAAEKAACDANKAQKGAEKAQEDAKKAQEDAKKAQKDAEKAQKRAEQANKELEQTAKAVAKDKKYAETAAKTATAMNAAAKAASDGLKQRTVSGNTVSDATCADQTECTNQPFQNLGSMDAAELEKLLEEKRENNRRDAAVAQKRAEYKAIEADLASVKQLADDSRAFKKRVADNVGSLDECLKAFAEGEQFKDQVSSATQQVLYNGNDDTSERLIELMPECPNGPIPKPDCPNDPIRHKKEQAWAQSS